MVAITVRNLSDETHRALRARAARNDRSVEAEVMAILDMAVSGERVRLGSLLVDLSRSVESEIESARERTPHEPLDL